VERKGEYAQSERTVEGSKIGGNANEVKSEDLGCEGEA